MKVSEIDFNKFRANLRKLIDSRGMTLGELSSETGMAAATISRYLNAVRVPDMSNVMCIADYFNVSIDWLVGNCGDKFKILPKELQDVAIKYSIASDDDKRVVDAVLAKYSK